TFYSLPIEGMIEYRTGISGANYNKYSALAGKIAAAGADNEDFDDFTEAEQEVFWGEALEAGGKKFAQEILDYVAVNYFNEGFAAYFGALDLADILASDGLSIAAAMRMWGFGGWTKTDDEFDGGFKDSMDNVYDLVDEFPTIDDFWACIHDAYGDDLSDAGINYESVGTSITKFVSDEFILIEVSKLGEDAIQEYDNISGIVKTSDYTLTITMTKFDATAIYKLGLSVAPLHYYGNAADYDYDNDKFGFEKNDLSAVESKTTKPMGAGPYKFDKFENGIVYFTANDKYYKGTPKIQTIHFRETSDSDKISGVIAGTFDITDPSISAAAVDQIKDANTNNTMNGNFIDTNLVDNLGYGYIGINANRVRVGTADGSEASKNLRKAYATLFAVHRNVVIDSYYGERAVVIEYPISSTSWAAPQPTDTGYALAYSVDVNGDPIYDAETSADDKVAAAIQAAIGFFEAAGFTRTGGKFTDVPEITAHIPADGTGDHPAFLILTNAKADLATIGVTLHITDYANSADFWPVLDGNNADIWCAAWGASIDPDMEQVYHSANSLIKPGGGTSNKYNIVDAELDEMIKDAKSTSDRAYRKTTYKEALELIMDWGVEIPIYQRKNAVIFSPERVDLDTLTPDITTFWGWMNDIENLEMK
ncbi:MAG: ABC transporter substrate-binding protein, partial [Clostridia bacterium]